MTVPAERLHQTADSIEATNRYLRRLGVIAVSGLLVIALTIIAWGAVTSNNEVQRIQERLTRFHQDSTCQTAALNQILIELADAQQDQQAGRALPRFVYPKPC